MIAVLLLTCGRVDYTRRTLESFSAQDPDARDRFLLLHADDASGDPAIGALATEHGFETVVQHQARRGVRVLRAAGISVAAARGADWVLVLENDWEWARPFPWALFDHLVTTRPDVYCLRLYGQYKARGSRIRCWGFHAGRNRQPVAWRRIANAPEPVEVGAIHWGAPPAVTRMAEARRLCVLPPGEGYDGSGDTHEMKASGALDALVARVIDNVVFHIGDETTATPRAARPSARRPASPPPLYSQAWQRTRRWTAAGSALCLDLAFQRLGPPLSMLDVGCGDGHLVRQAAGRGVDAMGVDLSTAPADFGPLRHADLREPLALGRTFDLVLCWEVAEHLPEAAADTLCDSLVRHLAPGGTLLFTAAHPGQAGEGHINNQPKAYWQARLDARGLQLDAALSRQLSAEWLAAAPATPWYGANLQIFHQAGAAARPVVDVPTVTGPTPVSDPGALPTLAITMRTADRSPRPNYVGATVRHLVDQGVDPASIHLCATDPDTDWLQRELCDLEVALDVPAMRRTPNQNGLAQIRCLDGVIADWVLLLEDDLEFCADFLGSVQRWLATAARPDRHVYRLFGFRLSPPHARSIVAYDWRLKGLCGSQAVLLRMAEARDFLAWGDANLETWGGFRGNAKIAFDKLIASWALTRWPGVPGVVSHPLFVRHVGDVSSLHPRAARNDALYAGARWAFRPQGATA